MVEYVKPNGNGTALDYGPGFNISAYLLDNSASALNIDRDTVTSDHYPFGNRSIDYSNDEVRTLLPLDYYVNPLPLLTGSVISLRSRIYMPQSTDNLSYAVVSFFDSLDEATSYQLMKTSAKKRVHFMNITNCTKSACTWNYTVCKNSILFPVLATKADSDFKITINFSFEVVHYVNPSSLKNVSTSFSMDSSGEIPLHPSKLILLYAHLPNRDPELYERLAYLRFICLPQYSVLVAILVALAILEVFILISCYCYCFKKCRVITCKRWYVKAYQPMSERTPLLINS